MVKKIYQKITVWLDKPDEEGITGRDLLVMIFMDVVFLYIFGSIAISAITAK